MLYRRRAADRLIPHRYAVASAMSWRCPGFQASSGMCDSGRWTRKDHEEIEVHGGADRLHSAAGGGRHGGRRGVPQGGDQRGDVLQLAQEVCRADAVGDEAAASARGGERQAEEDRRRPVARQGDAAGRDPPKALKPARKRQLVDHARATWRVSIRRACRALPVERSTYHYRSRRAGQAQLTERIKEIAATRVRYGYRRIHVLLRREGWRVNPKRVYRLYREMGLQLRNKTPKRRVKAKLREDRQPATRANETWAMDFVHDQLATGRKLRVLTIVDTFSRFSPAIEPRFNFRGADVVEVLEQSWPAGRIPEGDPGRSGHRVRLARSGSVGLPTRCHTRLLTARQADRQRLHRVLQRQVPSGMPERALVHEPRRCAPKMRGLA